MDEVLDRQNWPENVNDDRGAWVHLAQRAYSFNLQTAQRLAFLRWLVATNQLLP